MPTWAAADETLGDSGAESVTTTTSTGIRFYGGVNQDSAAKLCNELQKAETQSLTTAAKLSIDPPPVKLHIYSYGGMLHGGLAVYDVIRRISVPVHTIIEGVAASAATLISLAGDKRSIGPSACMLIHQLSTGFWGKYEELQDLTKNADLQMNRIWEIYRERTSIPEDVLSDILKHDLYWEAETCLKYDLVDEIS